MDENLKNVFKEAINAFKKDLIETFQNGVLDEFPGIITEEAMTDAMEIFSKLTGYVNAFKDIGYFETENEASEFAKNICIDSYSVAMGLDTKGN